jgi:hypothetical protein
MATLSSQSGPKLVMAGLDPAIHALAAGDDKPGDPMDARVKPVHDGLGLVPTQGPTIVLIPEYRMGALLSCELGNLMVVLPTGPCGCNLAAVARASLRI